VVRHRDATTGLLVASIHGAPNAVVTIRNGTNNTAGERGTLLDSGAEEAVAARAVIGDVHTGVAVRVTPVCSTPLRIVAHCGSAGLTPQFEVTGLLAIAKDTVITETGRGFMRTGVGLGITCVQRAPYPVVTHRPGPCQAAIKGRTDFRAVAKDPVITACGIAIVAATSGLQVALVRGARHPVVTPRVAIAVASGRLDTAILHPAQLPHFTRRNVGKMQTSTVAPVHRTTNAIITQRVIALVNATERHITAAAGAGNAVITFGVVALVNATERHITPIARAGDPVVALGVDRFVHAPRPGNAPILGARDAVITIHPVARVDDTLVLATVVTTVGTTVSPTVRIVRAYLYRRRPTRVVAGGNPNQQYAQQHPQAHTRSGNHDSSSKKVFRQA
jgi:hypothetical protein